MKHNPSLIIVGTVHRDPRGYARLYSLLERERPDILTVEISPFSRAYRTEHARRMRVSLRENLRRIQQEERLLLKELFSQSSIMGIFFLLKEPFEWRATEAFAWKQKVPLYDIDLCPFARDNLAYLSELMALENLRALIRFPLPPLWEQVEAQYSRARFLFHHPPSFWPLSQDIQEREAYMAEKIRKLSFRVNGGKLLHVGGWEHLIESSGRKSLFDLLKNMQPKRILLAYSEN